MTRSYMNRPRFRSVAERDRDQWALWLGLLAALLVLVLSSCTGTRAVFEGEVCGSPIKFTLSDFKDRSSFETTATCPDGQGGMTITTSESSTSAVVAAQAELATRLTALAEILARSLPMPPVAYRREVMPHTSGPVTDHDTTMAGAGVRAGDPPIPSADGAALERLAHTIEVKGRR